MVISFLVVPAEEVVPKVVLEIAPHRVHVVRPALDVVVLDEYGGAVDAVVVTLAGLRASGPAEVQILQSCLLNPIHLGMGDVVAGIVQIFLEKLHEGSTLFTGQVGNRDPLVILHASGPSVPGDDVARRLGLEDSGSELPGVQQGQEFTSESFLGAE